MTVGSAFQRPRDKQQEVEIRANWTRARKQLGPEATDITIHAQLNADIDVSFVEVGIQRVDKPWVVANAHVCVYFVL